MKWIFIAVGFAVMFLVFALIAEGVIK